MSRKNSLYTGEYEKGIKEEAFKRIMENKIPYILKNGEEYDVRVVNLHFVCSYTNEEVKSIVSLCYEMMEELFRIFQDGYKRRDLEESEREVKDKVLANELLQGQDCMYIYRSFKTDRTEKIIDKLGYATRVGGAYYMFISRPTFISGIYSAFQFVIDKFDDDEAVFTALFLLIRMAMHMHCDEVNDK